MSENVENKSKSKKIAVQYPTIPEKLTEIDSQYIKDYLADKFAEGTISKKKLLEWDTEYDKCVAEKDERTFFMPFRKKFAEEYFPELVGKKHKKDKKKMGDFLRDLANS